MGDPNFFFSFNIYLLARMINGGGIGKVDVDGK